MSSKTALADAIRVAITAAEMADDYRARNQLQDVLETVLAVPMTTKPKDWTRVGSTSFSDQWTRGEPKPTYLEGCSPQCTVEMTHAGAINMYHHDDCRRVERARQLAR